jgi:hypothetical protein
VDRRVIAVGSLVSVAFLGFLVQYIAPGLVDRVLRRGDDPLAVTVEIAPPVGAAGKDNNVFFVPRLADEIPPPPPGCRRMRDWAFDMGGSDVGTTTVRVYLQSSADHNVIVDGRVDVVQVGEQAPAGTLVSCEPGGDFGVPRRVEIDLEDGDQPWRFFVLDHEVPEAMELSIDAGEAEIVDLQATTSNGTYEWTARF